MDIQCTGLLVWALRGVFRASKARGPGVTKFPSVMSTNRSSPGTKTLATVTSLRKVCSVEKYGVWLLAAIRAMSCRRCSSGCCGAVLSRYALSGAR